MRWSIAFGVLAGCYSPSVPSEVPCGDNDACPSGQMCVAGVCTAMPALGPDAEQPPDLDAPAAIDAPVDTPPVPALLQFGERPGALSGTWVDTFLDTGASELDNFGVHADLHLSSAIEEPILIRVDVSAVPAIATVTAARLRFQVTAEEIPAGRIVQVFEMNESWTEGTGNNTPGVANHVQRNPGEDWAEHGAVPPAREATPIATRTIPALLAAGDELVLELPPALVAGWITSPASNAGVALLVVGNGFYCELGSSEGDAAARPVLEVELE